GARYLEMIEQCPHVLRHEAAVIGGRIVELGRRAMAAIVERDDAAARTRKRRYPAGIDPVHFLVGSKAMDEHDRLALPFVEIADLDLTMREMRHKSASYPLQDFAEGFRETAELRPKASTRSVDARIPGNVVGNTSVRPLPTSISGVYIPDM